MSVECSGPAEVLIVTGEIDMATAPQLRAELLRCLAQHPAVLVVDLNAVTFLASSGLAVFVEVQQAASDTSLRLVAGHRVVSRPIELVGLHQVPAVYPSRDDAMADTGRIGAR